jgi:hypothetical protein
MASFTQRLPTTRPVPSLHRSVASRCRYVGAEASAGGRVGTRLRITLHVAAASRAGRAAWRRGFWLGVESVWDG